MAILDRSLSRSGEGPPRGGRRVDVDGLAARGAAGARRPPHGLGPITAHRDTPQLRRGDELDARALGLVHLVDRGPVAHCACRQPGRVGLTSCRPTRARSLPRRAGTPLQAPPTTGPASRRDRDGGASGCGVRTGEREGGRRQGATVLCRPGRGAVASPSAPAPDVPTARATALPARRTHRAANAPAQRRATRPALERAASRDAHRSACECTAALSHGCGTRARPVRAAASSAAEAMVGFFCGIEAGLRGR